jgi:hypothetical protein
MIPLAPGNWNTDQHGSTRMYPDGIFPVPFVDPSVEFLIRVYPCASVFLSLVPWGLSGSWRIAP